MVPRDLHRGVVSRGRRVELTQLQLDALTDGAGTDAGRIQRLYSGQQRLNLCGVALNFGPQGIGDLVQRFGQVAVVADRVDDGACDCEFARFELGQLQLPQQMIL